MFRKVLIANRGEIAMRVIRACRELGIQTVAVHSDVDAGGAARAFRRRSRVHWARRRRQRATCTSRRSSAPPRSRGADAIHPGYGFLSENAEFAQVVQRCGLTFIGPTPEAMRLWGDKLSARELAERFGLPLLPGSERSESASHAESEARRVGFPVILKARGGGGGRGMRIVRRVEDVRRAFESGDAPRR